MLTVRINEEEVKGMIRQQIKDLVKEVDVEIIFWDTKELKKRTCLSWNTIQDQFFFDPRFPKYKVGSKWMFPAKQTKEFLLLWLSEQPRN